MSDSSGTDVGSIRVGPLGCKPRSGAAKASVTTDLAAVPSGHARTSPLVEPSGGTALLASLYIPLTIIEHGPMGTLMLSAAFRALKWKSSRRTKDIIMPSIVLQNIVTYNLSFDIKKGITV